MGEQLKAPVQQGLEGTRLVALPVADARQACCYHLRAWWIATGQRQPASEIPLEALLFPTKTSG